MNLRDKLIAFLERSEVDLHGELKDDTPLIKSGRMDSLSLFNLALFIEKEIGRDVDITAFDLAREWNTMDDILKFIVRERKSG